MNALRATAIVLSLLIHGTIGYAMLPSLENTDIHALDMGKGMDVVLVEQGIATAGISKLGDAMESIETSEIVPVQEQHAKPPEEVEPDELREVITSDASEVITETIKVEEPPPLETPPPEPQTVETKAQPEQVAIVTEQSSGEAKSGGDAKAFGRYLGQINDRVQRAKINPRSAVAGTVVMKFTVGTDGTLLSKEVAASSGSKMLDEAATAALDRAAPFPPIPPEISLKPLAFTQPFKFIMR